MDILDETVGPENWQKEYYEVKGNVYCRVGINTESGWAWKADCGIESNVDAQKGEASDAFKRAAVNWGIGRELYSGPRIKISCPDNYYKDERLTMSFYVHNISYDGKRITAITIMDRFNNVVFDWDCNNGVKAKNKPVQAPQAEIPPMDNLSLLRGFCKEKMAQEPEWKNDIKRFGTFYAEKLKNGWNGGFNITELYERWCSRRKAA